VAVEKQTHLIVSGADKGQVGQVAGGHAFAAPADPYKQKGVRITGERLKKKAARQERRPAAPPREIEGEETVATGTSSQAIEGFAPPAVSRTCAHQGRRHAGAVRVCACTARWDTFTRR